MLKVASRRSRRLVKIKEQERAKFRKMHLKKGDLVRVLAGKDRGKQGRIIMFIPEKERALVEKVNIIKRHQGPTATMVKGGIIEREGSVHVSNLMLVCPRCAEITRPKVEVVDTKKVRVCRECDEQIDKS